MAQLGLFDQDDGGGRHRIHGSRSTYQRGDCRCTRCTEANTAYQRRYRNGLSQARAALNTHPARSDDTPADQTHTP